MRFNLITILFALSIFGALAPAQAKKAEAPEKFLDRIDRKSGPSIANVRITKEDFRVVGYARPNGRSATIPSEEVIDVVRGGAPAVFVEGKSLAVSGALADAVGPLRLASQQAAPWVKEYSLYYLGEVLRKQGNGKEAAAAFEQALKVNGDSRLLPMIRLGTIKAHTASKNYSAAASSHKSFISEIEAKRLPRVYAVAAKQLLGKSLEAQGKFAPASREYLSASNEARGLLGKAKTDTEKNALRTVMLRAQRDNGSALVKDKKFSDATRVFNSLASKRNDPLAMAIGLMGQGEISLAKGSFDEARMRLTQVVSLHFGADEEVPRALRLLAEAYLGLQSKNNETGAGKMARLYLENLIERYPGSDEVPEARSLLQKIR